MTGRTAIPFFTYYVKSFGGFYVERKNFGAGFTWNVKTLGNFYVLRKKSRCAAFTLIELLVAVAAVALLAAMLIPALPAAKAAADAAACRSNLRQLAAANLAYAADHGRYVAAAEDIEGANSIRWHGVRSGGAFDGAKGPLAPYLGGGGASAWVRRCPGFRPDAAGFEASCGGYGYNALGVGSELCLPGGGQAVGMRPGALARPAQTVMFADAAYVQATARRPSSSSIRSPSRRGSPAGARRGRPSISATGARPTWPGRTAT